jgi:hypothetical protein
MIRKVRGKRRDNIPKPLLLRNENV